MRLRRLSKQGRHSHSFLSSSSKAQAAGRRAAQLVKERLSQSERSCGEIKSQTKLAHAGIQNCHNAPMAPPLHLATTYTRPPEGPYHDQDSIYTREDNPTRLLFEKALEELEGIDGCTAFAFSSGMSAVSNIVLAHESPLHVILLPHDLYHGVAAVLGGVFTRFGVNVHSLQGSENVKSQLQAKLDEIPGSENAIFWIETPSNPMTRVFDLKQLAQICASHGKSGNITTVVDSTLAPLQRPLDHGVDISMHSATKYLAGHSDVLAGVVTVHPKRRDLKDRVKQVQTAVGAVASPLDSWLALRGMRTLSVRLAQASHNALKLAQWLQAQPKIIKVHYPGLSSHTQHEIAREQLGEHFGGVLSIELQDEVQATAFVAGLTVAQRATSLGGTETLVEHRASIEPDHRRTSPPGLVRISVGLENFEDLRQDFEQAIHIMGQACEND